LRHDRQWGTNCVLTCPGSSPFQGAQLIEQTGITASGDSLKILENLGGPGATVSSASNDRLKLEEVERSHILNTLNSSSWKISGEGGAAELLGINPSTLRSRMRKLGIRRSDKERN